MNFKRHFFVRITPVLLSALLVLSVFAFDLPSAHAAETTNPSIPVNINAIPYPATTTKVCEVGGTYDLYTAAAYGTNKWVSSNTGVISVQSYSGQYCKIKCLQTGTASVINYVHYSKLVYDPVEKKFIQMPQIDEYLTYNITVRTPQCILENTGVTKTTATLKFDAPDGASSVSLYQSTNGGQTWTKSQTGTLTQSSTSAVASGLSPNTAYRFRLNVTGGHRNGASNTVSVTTKANVAGISLNSPNVSLPRGNTLTFSTTVSPANAENKNVKWQISNTLGNLTINPNGTASITANPDMNGTLQLTARSEEGNYTATCKVNITDPALSPPTNLRATETGDTYIVLAWNAVPKATGYYITIGSNKVGPIADTTHRFTDMTPGGTSKYTVTAYNALGESAPSGELSKTLTKSKMALTALSISDTTVKIKWTGVSEFSMVKSIKYRVVGSSTYTAYACFSRGDEITYSGFSPNKLYEITTETFDCEPLYVKTYPSGVTTAAQAPTASITGGLVESGTVITLGSATADATIYYTTDGSFPTSSSNKYTAAIPITGETLIKAYAAKSGLGDSLVSTFRYVTSAPPAPGSLTATGISHRNINLLWSPVSGADSYKLYRSESETGGYEPAATVSATDYTDTDLTTGKTYYYKVKALDKKGPTEIAGDYSPAASASVCPNKPYAFTAETVPGTRIDLRWSPADGAAGYTVSRATSYSGSYSQIASISGTSYADTSLDFYTDYYYKISAYALNGTTKVYGAKSDVAFSNGISVVLGVPSAKVSSYSYNGIKISWNEISGASGYEVYRATVSNGAYSKVYSATPGSTVSYTDTGLTTGNTYYYKVMAYRTVNGKNVNGSFSSVISAKPMPATPTVSVVPASYSSIRISWNQTAGASGYQIYRATSSGGTYSKVYTATSGSTVSYTNTGLKTGKTYYYQVRAYRVINGGNVYGNFSPAKYAIPVLAAPMGVKAAKASATSIKVSWGSVSGASGYEVYRATSSTGAYTKVKTTTSKSYTNTKLTSGKTYYYKVRAYRTVSGKKVYGPYSSILSITL